MRAPRIFFIFAISIIPIACSVDTSQIRFLPQNEVIESTSLAICDDRNKVVEIDINQPLNVFVHGCNSSGGIDFRALAQVFEFHEQQTLCFNYNDRDSLEVSSAQLLEDLNFLTEKMKVNRITVLGHSQGGLVARRTLIKNKADGLTITSNVIFQLITISSPFAGIDASSHCGLTALHIATLGISAGMCQIITGSKWNEIYPGSRFIKFPGALNQNVQSYLKIVTDERNTCLIYDEKGQCEEDDYAFSINEQYNHDIDSDSRLNNIEIKAGHSEIIGNRDIAPKKLIAILQSNAVLKQTPPEKKEKLENLLSLLY